jgi:hypothetical protein
MPAPPHSICRQYLAVDFLGSETDALALQRALPGLCADALAAAIARALDRCIPAGEYLRIDRLEVDAGSVAWPRLEQDFAPALQAALEKAVQEQLALAARDPDAAAGLPAVWHTSYGQALELALAYFLEHGSLPPAFQLPPAAGLAEALLAAWDQDAVAAAARSPRLLAALRRPAARARLATQFSTLFLRALLARLTGLDRLAIERAFAAIGGPGEAVGDTRTLERQCWHSLFERVAADSTLSLAELERTVAELREAWNSARTQPPPPLDRRPVPSGAGASPLEVRGERSINMPARLRAPPAPERAFAAPAHPDAGEGIFVNDAGLVLLHPFLGRLFIGLGLAEGDRLLQPERALQLLHFLCSGKEPAPEYELMLPKILCNVALTQPPATAIVLTLAEKEEAAALLGAVIGHWEVLRNTGADALRAMFLLRHGKLSERDGDWLLQVETDTVDILLGQLPWGISTVKLAWMDRILWVEWH